MCRTTWLRPFAAAGLLTLLVTAVPAADTPKDPPGTGPIMGQLRATFAAWDLNGDGFLDKKELAKAFRGADARPYDYKPESKADKPKDGDKKDGDPNKGPGNSSTKPDYSKYPDYEFLVTLDKDGDDKISKDEFNSWARDSAVSLKQQLDSLLRVAAVEQQLAALQNSTNKLAAKELAKEIKAIESELKKEQQAYNKMTKNAKNYEKHLLQALKQHGLKHHK